jgi:hypothetical protein
VPYASVREVLRACPRDSCHCGLKAVAPLVLRASAGFQRSACGAAPPIKGVEWGGPASSAGGRSKNHRRVADSPWDDSCMGRRGMECCASGDEWSALVRCYFLSRMVHHLKGIFFFMEPLYSEFFFMEPLRSGPFHPNTIKSGMERLRST